VSKVTKEQVYAQYINYCAQYAELHFDLEQISIKQRKIREHIEDLKVEHARLTALENVPSQG